MDRVCPFRPIFIESTLHKYVVFNSFNQMYSCFFFYSVTHAFDSVRQFLFVTSYNYIILYNFAYLLYNAYVFIFDICDMWNKSKLKLIQ